MGKDGGGIEEWGMVESTGGMKEVVRGDRCMEKELKRDSKT